MKWITGQVRLARAASLIMLHSRRVTADPGMRRTRERLVRLRALGPVLEVLPRLLVPGQVPVRPYPWSGFPGTRRGRGERDDPPAGLRRFGPAVVLADDEQARVLAPPRP